MAKRKKTREEIYQEGVGETFRAIPSTMAGTPMDIAELAAMGAYYGTGKEPYASKFKRTRPHVPSQQPLRKDKEFVPELIPGSSPWIHEKLGGDPSSAEFIGGSFLAGDLPWLKAASAMFGVGALALPMSKRISRADKLLEKGAPEDEILKKTGLVAADTKTGWRQPPETLALRTYGGKKTQLPRELQKQLMESDALSTLRMYLTEDELKSMTPETILAMEEMIKTGKTRTGKPITITHGKEAVPRLGQEEIGALAYAGRHKKGWYKHSAQQLRNVFGEDTERFIGLLAATSPQTSVEMNMENALRIWKNWDAAGRPTEDAAIKKIMGQSVVGKGTEESVMDAWVNNSITALKAEEPTEIVLSGPKANSFMKNLLEGYDEVTNDTWMGRAYNVMQDIFGGRTTVATEGKGAKGPGYLLSNAATRRAAAFLEKKTGQKWTAAEVQETVWSYVKAIYEKRRKGPGTQKSMQELSKDITAEDIAEVVDFASLMSDPKYSNILKGTKYEERLSSITPFQSEAEIGDLPSYRGREAAFGRALGGLESQFRETDKIRVIKKIREKIRRSINVDRTGDGKLKRPFTGVSSRNPGSGLKGLGKVTRYNLSPEDQRRLNSLGIDTPDWYELPQSPEAGARFRDAISTMKAENRFGAAVHVYDQEEYEGMRLFLTKDGLGGFALKGDDIVSGFNNPRSGRNATTITNLMLAVQEGGRKMDAFDTVLPQLYSRAGFRVSSRTVWNDEYAPQDWDKNTFQYWNQGEPDVVFMHYDPDSTEVIDRPGWTVYLPDDAERNAVLRDEYDDAAALQAQNVLEAEGRFPKGSPKAPWQIEEKGVVPFVKPGKQEKLMQRMYGESMAREALAGTQSGIGFTSPAMKVIVNTKDESLKPKVWLNKLKGAGVPKEELDFTGLGEWLQTKGKNPVTKQELQEFMETNQIQIQEVIYGEPGGKEPLADQYMRSWAHGDESKVRIPGGKNYRELVLTLPESQFHPPIESLDLTSLKEQEDLLKFQIDNEKDMLRDRWMEETGNTELKWEEFSAWETVEPYNRAADLDRYVQKLSDVRDQIRRISFEIVPPARWRGDAVGHYDEDNVLMHIRFNERVDDQGRKVLFVEELQSDVGQAGTKHGFAPDSKELERLKQRYDEIQATLRRRGRPDVGGTDEAEYGALLSEQSDVNRRVLEIEKLRLQKLAPGPFVMDTNTWTALGLKRLVRWATDNGYDSIAWTTPKQQTKRYGKEAFPERITYNPELKTLQGEDVTMASGGMDDFLVIEDVEVEDLPGFIGENAAAALMGKPVVPQVSSSRFSEGIKLDPTYHPPNQTITADDVPGVRILEIQDKGHQKFYDKLMLNQARSLADKYGGTVKKTNVIENPQIQRALSRMEENAGKIKWYKQVIAEKEHAISKGYAGNIENAKHAINVYKEKIDTLEAATAAFEKQLEPFLKERPSASKTFWERNRYPEQQWTWELTPKLKKAAKDGLPYYVALPPVYAGTKAAQQEDYDQDLTSRAAARAAYVQ